MEVLLDTNFVIYCIMKKIDFLEQIKSLGFIPIVPREVLQELKDLKESKKTSREEREAIHLALELFSSKKIKKMKLGGRIADEGLIAKGLKGIYIASLDRGVRMKVPNRIIILSDKKQLAIERK